MVIAAQRDLDELSRRLTAWFRARSDAGAGPEVTNLELPAGTGMSSETVLFDLHSTVDDERVHQRLVARLAPTAAQHPVFDRYDLGLQFRCLELVQARSGVPVPRPRWLEEDDTPIGSPFFVMDRVDGRVPSDNPPYVMGGWVVEASPEERARLQQGVVETLAGLHALDLDGVDTTFLRSSDPAAHSMDRLIAEQRSYYDWARGDRRFTVIDRAFEWIEAHRPTDPTPDGLVWGDARMGNMLWQGFEPAAVLDWEMATVGPPELDVAWTVHIAAFFAGLARTFELEPLVGFFDRDGVVDEYERATGRTLRDYLWYEVFAGLRYAVVSIRAGESSVRAGSLPEPEHHDGLILNAEVLTGLLDEVGG